MRNKKNIIIGILIAVIVLMSVGYAALAQVLIINGTAHINADWDVEITNIAEGTLIGATTATNPALGYTSTSATFGVDLAYPGASATYVVTIENKGNISAKLDSITGITAANASNPTEVEFAISGVAENDVLAPGATTTATITVTWVESQNETDTIPSTTTKTATINLNYIQNTQN